MGNLNVPVFTRIVIYASQPRLVTWKPSEMSHCTVPAMRQR